MRRVLLFKNKSGIYQFLSKIDSDYIKPKNTSSVTFFEGLIINDDPDLPLPECEIQLIGGTIVLVENGLNDGQFIVKS